MRSKMLDAFVKEIAHFLNEEQWDRAERLAAALPHIATALSDADLRSSQEVYQAWCKTWIDPGQSDSVYDQWHALSPGATLRADTERLQVLLHTLTLVRRLRGRAVYPPNKIPSGVRGKSVTLMCESLVAAFEKWRRSQEKSNPTIGFNLAKIGVLR